MLINTLFDLCRIIHDSVDCLSPSSEINQIAVLLGGFIDKINFGKDLEQQLNFYVECRAAFCNIDQIKDRLIGCVGGLAMRAFQIMKGKHIQFIVQSRKKKFYFGINKVFVNCSYRQTLQEDCHVCEGVLGVLPHHHPVTLGCISQVGIAATLRTNFTGEYVPATDRYFPESSDYDLTRNAESL